jgi:hypothetical protein
MELQCDTTYADNGNSFNAVGETSRLVFGVLLGHVFGRE